MKRLKVFALLALLGLLVTASITTKNHHLLFSEHAPAGIFSLELTASDSIQYEIFSEWNNRENYVFERDWSKPADSGTITKTDVLGKIVVDSEPGKRVYGVDAVKRQTYGDLGFIFFYVFSFILLFWYCYKRLLPKADRIDQKFFRFLCGAIILVGMLDYIEDFYIFQSIELFQRLNPDTPNPKCLKEFVNSGSAQFVYLPALFKFILLALLLLVFGWQMNFFKRLTQWMAGLSGKVVTILGISWKFRIVLLVLFVLYGLLNFSDQGQDLLVSINTSSWGTVLFLFSISVFAALNWHLPKLYEGNFTDLLLRVPKGYHIQDKDGVYYARLLGIITFLVPATAILSTMRHYHMPYLLDDVPPTAILLVMVVFYQQVLKKNGLDFFFKPQNTFSVRRYAMLMAVIFLSMIGFYYIRNSCVEHYGRLSYLSLDLFLLSFAFMVSVNYRTEIGLVKAIKVGSVVLISGFGLALVFILFNIPYMLFNLTAGFRFFTLAVVIAALICYVLLFSYLLMLGKRTKIQWITFLLTIGLLVSYFKISGFHKVHTVKTTTDEPMALSNHIRNWLRARRDSINTYEAQYGRPYPVFFLNSYGGGIRAASWATMVVGELDSNLLISKKSKSLKDDFQHHVLSFSGASGGTVGFSLLVADRLHAKDTVSRNFYPARPEVYRHDYLTPNVVGMFGRDVLMSVIGGAWYEDRSRLQERSFERLLCEKFDLDYNTPLKSVWEQDNFDLPLLFSNTYDINTGKKGIVAPVLLEDDDFPSCIFIHNLLKPDTLDLKLSTGAFLSARFPFVCPTGKFSEKNHFTDGGTLENSGGQTSRQVIKVFERVFEEEEFKDLKISINLLSISSSFVLAKHPVQDKNMYEVFAPAMGLLKTINSNAIREDEVNRIMVARKLTALGKEMQPNKNNGVPKERKGGLIDSWSYAKVEPTQEMIEGNWPVLPLGWQISDNALKVMAKSLADQHELVKAILLPFGNKQPLIKANLNKVK